jgi:hypothetical protein
MFLTWHQCISNNIYINDISVFHMTSTFININDFPDMTSTFMTSVFFRHDIYIDDISVFHTWHIYSLQLVFFRHDIYIYYISVSQAWYIHHGISIFQTWNLHLWHQHILHEIYINDISVFQTWHLHWWHQCFSHDIKWKPFHLQMDDEELIQQ